MPLLSGRSGIVQQQIFGAESITKMVNCVQFMTRIHLYTGRKAVKVLTFPARKIAVSFAQQETGFSKL